MSAVALGCVWWLTWQVIASHVTGLSSDKDSEKWILAFNLPAFTLQMVGAFPSGTSLHRSPCTRSPSS